MNKPPVCEVIADDTGVFVRVDGVRVANRDPQGGMWVSRPGWVVKNVQSAWDHSELVVEHNGVRVH